jgi:hypothetical protein
VVYIGRERNCSPSATEELAGRNLLSTTLFSSRIVVLNLSFSVRTKLLEPARRFDMDKYEKIGPRIIPNGGEHQKIKQDAEARMRERDARIDDRTEADRLLGVPPSWRSALSAALR